MIITISNDNDPESVDMAVSDNNTVSIVSSGRKVVFTSDTGETLSVSSHADGFEFEYLDNEDVVQTWHLQNGFVRRVSLKGKNGSVDNVVPFPKK